MDIVLFNSTAETNLLNKSGYLTTVSTLSGTLRAGANIVDPEILVELDSLPTFNYVYINAFNRYYFVRGIDNIRNKLWVIRLHVDVLMSYKTEIADIQINASRNQYDYDFLLEDSNRGYEHKSELTYIEPSDATFAYQVMSDPADYLVKRSFVISALK